MRVALVAPDWGNAWIPMLSREIESQGHEFLRFMSVGECSGADVAIHGWLDGAPVDGARNVFCLRRYELFSGCLNRDWSGVDALIVCNEWIRRVVVQYFDANGIDVPVHLIYNSVDPSAWLFSNRSAGPKIGMTCHIHPKKNLPMALQILSELPERYSLHIAGAVQDPCTAEYLNFLGNVMRRSVYLYGHIPRDQLDLWWEDKNFCLSTSISEGNPNSVLEAMAKGIKPIVHRWPGALVQFPSGTTFQRVSDAVRIIKTGDYQSADYLSRVKESHGLRNISRLVDVAIQGGERNARI